MHGALFLPASLLKRLGQNFAVFDHSILGRLRIRISTTPYGSLLILLGCSYALFRKINKLNATMCAQGTRFSVVGVLYGVFMLFTSLLSL